MALRTVPNPRIAMKKNPLLSTLLSMVAFLCVGVADAQQSLSVARVVNIEGNVLVSQNDAMVAASNDQPLPAGARVVTMAESKAVIRYDSGCEVVLKGNQRFTVRVGECPALLAEVVSVGPAPTGALTANTALGIAGVAGFGYGAYEFFKNKSVSPN
jgi:hypothetical protein